MRKRIIVAMLSFSVGSILAAGCGLDEGGFSLASEDGSPGPRPDTGTSNPPVDGGGIGDAKGDVSSGHDAGACAACPPQTVCVENACGAARRVFVSSTQSTAAFGGVSGADTKCQNLADGMKLGGNWRAWISDQINSPSARFAKANVPYRLLDGTLVADNWSDLTDGALDHGIDRDEKGNLVDDAEVWTGTTASGGVTGDHCNNFSSESPTGYLATVGNTTLLANWTARYKQFCNRTDVRIYCFEQ
ncbi:DUF1554 domain-containing protein [Pendulispora brunnea]|uniref:DUF1554 domain-containing protein n=1 Tax=Pendulispora brunnea TaxID=2905690 RepID=A0ABZ2JZA3_9BACT